MATYVSWDPPYVPVDRTVVVVPRVEPKTVGQLWPRGDTDGSN